MSGPAHAPMSQWGVVDDCLIVGGMPLTRLAQRVGRTPFYAYDRRLLDARVELLRQHLPREIKLHYAMKANPCRHSSATWEALSTELTSRRAANST